MILCIFHWGDPSEAAPFLEHTARFWWSRQRVTLSGF